MADLILPSFMQCIYFYFETHSFFLVHVQIQDYLGSQGYWCLVLAESPFPISIHCLCQPLLGWHSFAQILNINLYLHLGLSWGSVVENLPASAGDMGSIPGPRSSHMPWSNEACVPQLLSLCSGAPEPQLLSHGSAAAEDCKPWRPCSTAR